MLTRVIGANCQRRALSSLFNNSKSTNTVATDLPQVTGHGPFAEPPTFNVLGSPASLLDIKLPASAVLNLRLSTKFSVVGINGNVDNLSKEITMIKSSIKPIIYHRIFNPSPLSFLISNHLNFQNFIVLKVKENWFINEANLIAWHGSEIVPKLSNKLLDTFYTVAASGEGVIALKGNGNIFKVDLAEDESMLINPDNLVAHNSAHISTTKLETKMVNIRLPTFTNWESITLYYKTLLKKLQTILKIKPSPVKTPSQSITENKYIEAFNGYLKNRREKKNKDNLFKVEGPVTLVLQNNI